MKIMKVLIGMMLLIIKNSGGELIALMILISMKKIKITKKMKNKMLNY